MPAVIRSAKLDLNEGIMLEDSGDLIPWGARVDQLRAIASPNVYRHPTTRDAINRSFVWQERRILNGLSCTVETVLRLPTTTYKQSGQPLRLNCVGIEVFPENKQTRNSIDELESTIKHLDRVLPFQAVKGEYFDGYMDLPYCVYRDGSLELALVAYERFTLGFSFSIRRLRKNARGCINELKSMKRG